MVHLSCQLETLNHHSDGLLGMPVREYLGQFTEARRPVRCGLRAPRVGILDYLKMQRFAEHPLPHLPGR